MVKFQITITIADVWIEDGLTQINPDSLRDAINTLLFAGYARDNEIGIEVTNPSNKAIQQALIRADKVRQTAA